MPSDERTIKTKHLGVVSAAINDEFEGDEVLLVRIIDFEWLVARNRELRVSAPPTEG